MKNGLYIINLLTEPQKSIKICTHCHKGYSYQTDLFSNPYICYECDKKCDNISDKKCDNNDKKIDCQCVIL